MYHLKMNFLIDTGIGEVRGKQVLAHECHVQELKNGVSEIQVVKDAMDKDKIPPTLELID